MKKNDTAKIYDTSGKNSSRKRNHRSWTGKRREHNTPEEAPELNNE